VEAAYIAHVTAQAAAVAAHQKKVGSCSAFVALLRPAVRRVQSFEGTTDAQRGAMGITIPDRVRSRLPAPSTFPGLRIQTIGRLTHTLHINDSATPTKRAKPNGVTGAEIWIAFASVGAAVPEPPMPGREAASDGGGRYFVYARSRPARCW